MIGEEHAPASRAAAPRRSRPPSATALPAQGVIDVSDSEEVLCAEGEGGDEGEEPSVLQATCLCSAIVGARGYRLQITTCMPLVIASGKFWMKKCSCALCAYVL